MKSLLRLALFLALSALLLAEPTRIAISPSEYAFTPYPAHDGYIQAWNVNFRNESISVYTTFLISNIGPKSLNNGVSVLVYEKGESKVWTAEFDYRTLHAQPGKFGHTSGKVNEIGMENGNFFAKARIADLDLRISVNASSPGIRLSNGPLPVSKNQQDFIRADIPCPSSQADLRLTFNGQSRRMVGTGTVESLLTNESPHHYAERFVLGRSDSTAPALYVGGFQGNENFPGRNVIEFIFSADGKNFIRGSGNALQMEGKSVDPFSGYTVPTRTTYSLKDESGRACRIQQDRASFSGGYSVFGHITPFLRFILSLFFARPYVLHYQGQASIQCDGAVLAAKIPIDISYYIINE